MSLRLFLVAFVTPGIVAAEDREAVFGSTTIHPVRITVSANDYRAMDPPQRNGFGPPAGGPRVDPRVAGAGNFGFEFDYVHAEVAIGDRTWKDIGLRYKGSGTYMMSQRQTKRSLKIDFDRYDAKQEFRGFKKLNLNSGVMDPTKIREALAYEVFRLAGVPASRTAFAEVALTVPGRFDGEYLGVFTVVEQVDKAFLKTHFKDGKGLLLKPEGIRGLPYLGEDAAAYEKSFVPKDEADPKSMKRLIDFTRLVNRADDATFRKEIRGYLDVDRFVGFLAANAMLASLDGFLGLGHNYYLYLSPETNQFTFIPWDLDLAFGGFFMFGSADQQADLSIEHPFVGENKLVERLLAMPEVKKAYLDQVRKLTTEVFTAEKLGKEIDALEKQMKPLIAKETRAAQARREGGGFGAPFGGVAPSLKSFVEKRAESVAAQLAGTRKGTIPAANGFGGPPGGFGAPAAFGPGAVLSRPLLDSLDMNRDGKVSEDEMMAGMKKHFEAWDRNKDGTLDPRELAEGLQKLVPTGPPR